MLQQSQAIPLSSHPTFLSQSPHGYMVSPAGPRFTSRSPHRISNINMTAFQWCLVFIESGFNGLPTARFAKQSVAAGNRWHKSFIRFVIGCKYVSEYLFCVLAEWYKILLINHNISKAARPTHRCFVCATSKEPTWRRPCLRFMMTGDDCFPLKLAKMERTHHNRQFAEFPPTSYSDFLTKELQTALNNGENIGGTSVSGGARAGTSSRVAHAHIS